MGITPTMLSFLLLVASFSGHAQTPLELAFSEIQTGSELPAELQSTRSAVFLKFSSGEANGTRLEWNPLIEELHENLVSMHIDAVAYYYWQDLNAGFDATESYMEVLRAREINQVILLSMVNMQYQIYIIPTDDHPGLLSKESPSWHTSSSSLEGAIEILAVAVRRTGLEVANLLIAESSELFVDTRIFSKNRFESFQPDLKLDKLAAPLFNAKDPDKIETSEDVALESIMHTHYPFKYELVSSSMTEDLMKKAGFHYVLRFLSAEESTVKMLLDYTYQMSSPSKPVYKFYMKHLITGDIYLGNAWDGQVSWQEALNVHLTDMKKALKVK